MSKVKTGQTVSVHYVGKFNDGTEFDNSRNRGEPVSFEVGSGQLISGFDSALEGMVIGETKAIKLEPSEAYGEVNENLVQTVPQESFPPEYEFKVGNVVQGQNATGQQVTARIDSVDENVVVLNFNHPMAGRDLNFEIELLSVQ